MRVLVVGDSWARFLWTNQSLRTAFATNGHSHILEEGETTTISGTTAAEWTAPDKLQLITDALAANPEVEVVQLTIGGNDFLDGQPTGGWYVGMPPSEFDLLSTRIQDDLTTVINHILQIDPELDILISLYDYVNFVDYGFPFSLLYCDQMFSDMNSPNPLQVNTAMAALTDDLIAFADGLPGVDLRHHTGLMQYLFGIPGVAAPYTLLPPGDPNHPSPASAMLQGVGADCIHLSETGYYGVAEHLWWTYYFEYFGGLFVDGFESGDLTAWQ